VVEKRLWRLRGIFTAYELALAVCQDYFSVAQVLELLECLPEGPMQPLVVREGPRWAEPEKGLITHHAHCPQVCTMFSRIVDLENMDRILRTLAPDLAKEVRGLHLALQVYTSLNEYWGCYR
jgi:hypothetical protein